MTTGSDPPATRDDGFNSKEGPVPGPQGGAGADLDDFGLPLRPPSRQPRPESSDSDDDDDSTTFHDAADTAEPPSPAPIQRTRRGVSEEMPESESEDTHTADGFKASAVDAGTENTHTAGSLEATEAQDATAKPPRPLQTPEADVLPSSKSGEEGKRPTTSGELTEKPPLTTAQYPDDTRADEPAKFSSKPADARSTEAGATAPSSPNQPKRFPSIKKEKRKSGATVSEWSHQKLATKEGSESEEEEVEWQAMPALGEMDYYDDRGRLVAKGAKDDEPDTPGYAAVGFSTKGYTKLQLDEDAQSATSMDNDTEFLFKKDKAAKDIGDETKAEYEEEDDDELNRDAATQLQNTKDLLTEGQRIAYVGVVRLTIFKMLNALSNVEKTKGSKKDIVNAVENMEIWAQQMMVRLFAHMEIDSAEQVMIEQLAEHGVTPDDLVPALMQNAKIKNNKKEADADTKTEPEPPPPYQPDPSTDKSSSMESAGSTGADHLKEVVDGEEVPTVQESLPAYENIEVDVRWTVLCDLFLVLISDGNYDSRSRRLLERVASALKVTWQQICRFEKRVVEAIEMQEAELRESLDESENLEKRRKAALKRRYITMGLMTVGGAAVIGLSAGLLAPVIGAGLAAGFGTIGVGGTTAFLTGAGGAAIVTSIGVTTGGTIALRASDRRMGHVKTFEYRPLHNNKRLNLILSVSGWMAGKVDDVRLPFSTVDPMMGDIYSLLWEPDMLRSTGDTINILATEALTQSIQQVLGSTLLIGLMSAIQLPIVLTKLAYLIDNPWSVSLDRANAAGLILADSLIQRHLGTRPITLVGFSLGARLIFSCLKELANRGAYGIVQNVYLFGAPVVAKRDEYLRARTVIAGRFVNGYAANDWILGYLFRATAGGLGRVAGLAAVEDIPGMENKDVSQFVNGHMAYRAAMPRLLREVGWEVESDEFTDIEDPDPDNHEARQRELIREIDEARKKAEEEPQKTRFGFFKRGKPAEKKSWEAMAGKGGPKSPANISDPGNPQGTNDSNVLFDIEAIRRELASEYVEVRELDSTMPAMQIMTVGKDGQQQTEYLRLPSDVKLTPEEMARVKMPPRPEDDGLGATPMPSLPPRTTSLQPSPRRSPGQSPRHSPVPSMHPPSNRTPSPRHDDYGWDQPKELVSTLPPLDITPSIPQHSFEAARPALKPHASEPPPLSRVKDDTGSPEQGRPPVDAYNLEHNAWADDGGGGEIKMTFE